MWRRSFMQENPKSSTIKTRSGARIMGKRSKRVEGYPIHTTTVTTSHCAFLLIHPNISFQHRHCHTIASTFHTFWFTPSNVLLHPFMLNLLFAYAIYLIIPNVGPTTNPYYTKCETKSLSKIQMMAKEAYERNKGVNWCTRTGKALGNKANLNVWLGTLK